MANNDYTSIRIETDLISYQSLKYDHKNGEIEVKGKRYEVLVQDGDGYKTAREKLKGEQLSDLIQSIKELFNETELQFTSLKDLVIDANGVYDVSNNPDTIKLIKEDKENIAQKVTQLARGVQFSTIPPKLIEKEVIRKNSGKEEEENDAPTFMSDWEKFLKYDSATKYPEEKKLASKDGKLKGNSSAITSLGTLDDRRVKDSPGDSKEYDFLSNFYEREEGKYAIPTNVVFNAAGLSTVEVEDVVIKVKSTEHLYQAIKVLGIPDKDKEIRARAFKEVINATSPGEARRIAQTYENNLGNEYWNDGRVAHALKLILMYKFVKDPLAGELELTEEGKKLLIMTEGKEIIEGINKGDRRCAMELVKVSNSGYEFRGKNILGKMLMKIRDLLLQEFEVKNKKNG